MRKELFIKRELLDYVIDGSKKVDVRIDGRQVAGLQAGDIAGFRDSTRTFDASIKDVRHYPSGAELLDHEDPSRICPGSSREDLERMTPQFFTATKKGFVAIELE